MFNRLERRWEHPEQAFLRALGADDELRLGDTPWNAGIRARSTERVGGRGQNGVWRPSRPPSSERTLSRATLTSLSAMRTSPAAS
jgi:hypothetical protein